MAQHKSKWQSGLIEALHDLEGDPKHEDIARESERIIHELQAQQIELELQNRQLRDTQALLEESRNRYADLFDFAPVGYCTLDRDGIVIEANLTAATLLGTRRVDLLGRSLTAVARMVSPQAFRAHLAGAFSGDEATTIEVTVQPPGSPQLVLHIVSLRAFDAAGNPLDRCRATLTDVTERRRAQNLLSLLANASERLASSLDYASTIAEVARLTVPILADACFVDITDEENRLTRLHIAFGDPARQAMVDQLDRRGLTPRQGSAQYRAMRSLQSLRLQGEDCREAIPAELDAACGRKRSALIVPLVAREVVLGVVSFFMLDSGRSYDANDLRFAEDIARRAATAVDNARLYRDAQRAIRAREEILSNVSHDLRNSLSSIVMNASLMLRNSPADDRRRERWRVEILKRGAERMQRMTEDLLDISSIDAGRLAVERNDWDVDELMADAFEALLPLAGHKGQQLECESLGRPARVHCDKDRVIQVFSNLVGNAIKFTQPNGKIVMRVERLDAVARFSVRDDGPGISDDQARRLFQRYWHTRAGQGLGLHISKGIVESQGGSIWVETRLGEGSTFYFTLPLGADRVQELEEAPRGTILIVDDNDEIRVTLQEVLESGGYRTAEAADGDEALTLMCSGLRPSLILLDLQMPRMPGSDFLRALGRQHIDVPPVMLISCDSNVDAEAARLGAIGYLRKPFEVGSLLSLVAQQHERPALLART